MATIPIPSTSVSMDTIKQTLTDYGGSVSNDLLTFFTSGAKINPWSKWKPIIYPADFVDSEASMKAYNWGINVSGLTTTSVSEAFNGSTINEWRYTLPTGGARAPYRLGDFRKYRADATSPFKDFTVDEVSGDTNQIGGEKSKFDIYIRYFLNNEDDEVEGGMISLKDLKIFDDTWNTHRVGVIDYFNREYKLTTGDLISTNWGSASITINWDKNNDIGVHELAAVLYTDNGNLIPLPFPRRKVNVLKYYGTETLLNTRAQFAYTSDGSEGKFDIYYDYIRGNNQSEDTKFTISIAYGTDSSYIGQITLDTFTIPDSYANEAGDFIISRHLTFDQNNSLWSTWVRMANEGNLYAYINGQKVDNTTIG